MKEKNKPAEDVNKDSTYRKRRGNPHGNARGNRGKRDKLTDDNLRDGVSESQRSKQ